MVCFNGQKFEYEDLGDGGQEAVVYDYYVLRKGGAEQGGRQCPEVILPEEAEYLLECP